MNSDESNSQGSLRERLSRIETKIDSLCAGKKDVEDRLRSLERERWMTRGAIGLLLTIGDGKLGSVVRKMFGS